MGPKETHAWREAEEYTKIAASWEQRAMTANKPHKSKFFAAAARAARSKSRQFERRATKYRRQGK